MKRSNNSRKRSWYIWAFSLCMMIIASFVLSHPKKVDAAWDGPFRFIIKDGVLVDYLGDLSEVVIPDGVVSIGPMAFWNKRMISVVIPDTVTEIGDEAFLDCTSLKSVVIPESVTSIGNRAFNYCKKLSKVSIPKSVTYIGDEVFQGSQWLSDLKKKNTLVVVNNILIDGTGATGKVTIPKNVKMISGSAFSGSKLESISIPSSVTYIGSYCFSYCKSLKKITIPDSVSYIGEIIKHNHSSDSYSG